ncbi:ATP-binding cassette domain-containing protein [Prolixibacter bellariivorans]|uniref:ATP-binding cassette domain-containing protein n=1 Tax=Prolixibacter bellariivorans TaxID=314319 RepID=UPI000A803AF2|nr:ATP-binding cassette domain-containing protein [Prolixibacter bellariivorans]
MRILVTLMKPSKGQVLVNGLDLQKHRREIRQMLGYLPQDFRFFAKLTTWEFLDYSARLAGISQRKARLGAVEQMLEEVGLYEARNRMANKLSGGMKRRLGIAQALIGEPKIIVVDELRQALTPRSEFVSGICFRPSASGKLLSFFPRTLWAISPVPVPIWHF